MAAKHLNYTTKQHVAGLHPPVIKPILQDNYHGFLQYAQSVSPGEKNCQAFADEFCFLLAHSKTLSSI